MFMRTWHKICVKPRKYLRKQVTISKRPTSGGVPISHRFGGPIGTSSWLPTYGQYLDAFEGRMDKDIVRAIRNDRQVSGPKLMQFGQIFTDSWHKLAPVFARCDALLCPTESMSAPHVDFDEISALEIDGAGKLNAMDMTMQFNALMLPAISIPSGFSHDGFADRDANHRAKGRGRYRFGVGRHRGRHMRMVDETPTSMYCPFPQS